MGDVLIITDEVSTDNLEVVKHFSMLHARGEDGFGNHLDIVHFSMVAGEECFYNFGGLEYDVICFYTQKLSFEAFRYMCSRLRGIYGGHYKHFGGVAITSNGLVITREFSYKMPDGLYDMPDETIEEVYRDIYKVVSGEAEDFGDYLEVL